MPRGGARNRSGPPKDPNSGRSDRLGFKLTALPAEGYKGKAPEFPLPKVRVYNVYFEDKKPVREYDEGATETRWDRECDLWAWAWRTPQACAWSMPSEAWRLHSIAMWVRTFVICESSEGTAADKSSLHRFADQIGMTPAGLVENGWAIAGDEVAAKRESQPDAEATPARKSSRDRLSVVNGAG